MKKTTVLFANCMLILFAAVFLTGCGPAMQHGRKFDTANVKNIKKGATKKGDLLQMFGQPASTSVVSGHETWTYSYGATDVKTSAIAYVPYVNLFAGRAEIKSENSSLTLALEKDVVRECTFSYSSSASRTGTILNSNHEQTAPTTHVTEPCGD